MTEQLHTHKKKDVLNIAWDILTSKKKIKFWATLLVYFAKSGNSGGKEIGLSSCMHQRALLLAQEAGRAGPGLSQAERSMSVKGGRQCAERAQTGQVSLWMERPMV